MGRGRGVGRGVGRGLGRGGGPTSASVERVVNECSCRYSVMFCCSEGLNGCAVGCPKCRGLGVQQEPSGVRIE